MGLLADAAERRNRKMTWSFRPIVLAAGILVLVGVHDARAQIDDSIEFTATFPFTVGNTTLPAGTYTITPSDIDPQVLQMEGARTSVLFMTEPADPSQTPSKTELVFNRYGDRYVLKNVWVAGSDIGYATENALAAQTISSQSDAPTEARVEAHKTAKKKA
jgi:hypothetical protein